MHPRRPERLFDEVQALQFRAPRLKTTVSEVRAKDQIVSEGELPKHLHFLLDGLVELSAGQGKKRSTIGFLHPKDAFILAAVVTDAPYLMTARAIGPARLLMVPAHRFRSVMGCNSRIAAATSIELGQAFRCMVRQLRAHTLKSAGMRLATYLACEFKRLGQPSSMSLPFSKRVLASHLGIEPESLSRLFISLGQHGVEIRGDAIFIRNLDALERLAELNPAFDEPD